MINKILIIKALNQAYKFIKFLVKLITQPQPPKNKQLQIIKSKRGKKIKLI